VSDGVDAAPSVRVAVLGASGRMGRAVASSAREAADIAIVGGFAERSLAAADARDAGFDAIAGLADAEAAAMIEEADVVIDFSTPAGLAAFVEAHGDRLGGRALVSGTTGLDADAAHALEVCARRSPVLSAPNFSIGVNLLLALVERAAATLDAAAYDVEIIEAHHGGKAEAPSGTALALGGAVARARGVELESVRRDGRSGRPGVRPAGEIGFHAVRGGGIAGEHRVQFLGRRDRIELGHEAFDRALFADGALAAARWIARRPPGRYTMADVLGF